MSAAAGTSTAAGVSEPAAGHAADAGGAATLACPSNGLCYDFEAGVLPPNGQFWTAPTDAGSLPRAGQFTTPEYPPGSGNHVFASRPSKTDQWPKATMGYTTRRSFRKLTLSFDVAVTNTLSNTSERVILARFIGSQGAGSTDLGLRGGQVDLEIQRDPEGDSLTPIARAQLDTLTHVSLVVDRSAGSSCTASATYGTTTKNVPMPCDLDEWQIELGLDVVIPPGAYTAAYVAYYDNLSLVTEP